MFDSDHPEAYENVYIELVDRLKQVDLESHAKLLELDFHNEAAYVPFFSETYYVKKDGVFWDKEDDIAVSIRIVLAHYLLYGGQGEPARRFIPYRELRGGCDFSRNLALTVEKRIAQYFACNKDVLEKAACTLGGKQIDTETSCDVAFSFHVLPKVPMMFTFYDQDEDFPAEVKVFYDAKALDFLDLECLAVLGMLLASELERVAG